MAPEPGHYYDCTDEEWADKLERLRAAGANARILLRGASVLTVDPKIGDFDSGDVLIDGNVIAAVGADLSQAADDCRTVVLDLKGAIVMPGLIDGHRHCWQNQFRRLIPDADLAEYLRTMHGDFAGQYRPEDIYAGNILTMLTLLDGGVTCITDCAHNSRSRAHNDAAFRSYADSGIRAVHVPAPSSTGDWENHLPKDLLRLRQEYCRGNHSLTTVRMGIDMRRTMPLPDLLGFAREHGFGIHIDGVMGLRCEEILDLGRAGLLGPDLTLIHCNDMPEEGWRMIADTGTKITLGTTSEQQLGLGTGVPVIQEALNHGIRPCLSGDVEVCLAGDIFTQMRTTVTTQRMLARARTKKGEPVPPLLTHRDVIEFATIRAADSVGLAEKIGSLTPGKYADIIVIQAEDINNLPLNNATGTVALATESKNIDIVFVAGIVKKWRGGLIDQDLPRLRQLVHRSRDRLAHNIGLRISATGKPSIHHTADDAVVSDLIRASNQDVVM
jgi:cytosine/adenosine deaminase-related metal-dependent hydrolase